MAWFLDLCLVISVLTKGYSRTMHCDETLCDFGTCNNGNTCQYNQYICTNKASQCLLQCNSHCHGISITSSAQYTQIICNNHQSCNDVQVSIPQPNLNLDLECKKRSSCLDINIQSNALSTFQCQSLDPSQCTNNVNVIWLPVQTPVQSTTTTTTSTARPTSKPTTRPTVSTTTAKPTVIPTLNPTIQHIFTTVTSPPTMQRLAEIIVVTKTVIIFAKQSTPKPNHTYSWGIIILVILCTVFGVMICILGVMYVRHSRTKDGERLDKTPNGTQSASDSESDDVGSPGANLYCTSPLSEMYKSRTMSEGDMELNPMEGVECAQKGESMKYSYDGLYENRFGTATHQYTELDEDWFDEVEILVTDQEPQTTHATAGAMDYDDPSLPEEMMIGSVSSDDLNLLYGPGRGHNKTRG
eukprot:1118720_1